MTEKRLSWRGTVEDMTFHYDILFVEDSLKDLRSTALWNECWIGRRLGPLVFNTTRLSESKERPAQFSYLNYTPSFFPPSTTITGPPAGAGHSKMSLGWLSEFLTNKTELFTCVKNNGVLENALWNETAGVFFFSLSPLFHIVISAGVISCQKWKKNPSLLFCSTK